MSLYTFQQIHSRRASQVALGFSMPRSYTEATDQQAADNANWQAAPASRAMMSDNTHVARGGANLMANCLLSTAVNHMQQFRRLQHLSSSCHPCCIHPTTKPARPPRSGLFRVNLAPDYCGCARRSGLPRSVLASDDQRGSCLHPPPKTTKAPAKKNLCHFS